MRLQCKKTLQIINYFSICCVLFNFRQGLVKVQERNGLPDWPKCFGQWIPHGKSQLPSNYKEIFKVQGKEIADFNAFKTWTEYINRLIGVIIGFCVLAVFITSFSYIKDQKEIPLISFFTLIVLGFQGWLGSVVVSTNLAMDDHHSYARRLLHCFFTFLPFAHSKSRLFERPKPPLKKGRPSWSTADSPS